MTTCSIFTIFSFYAAQVSLPTSSIAKHAKRRATRDAQHSTGNPCGPLTLDKEQPHVRLCKRLLHVFFFGYHARGAGSGGGTTLRLLLRLL